MTESDPQQDVPTSEGETATDTSEAPSGGGLAKPRISVVRVAQVLVPMVLAVLLVYQFAVSKMPQPTRNQQTMKRIVGLANPIENRLDERFTDTNGDLLADAPTDPSKWVDPEVLRFSYIATQDDSRYPEVWKEFVEHLSQATGKPVEYAELEGPADQLRALKDGELHVTGLNTGNVPIAVNDAGFIPVCTPGVAAGDQGYTMQIIVPADSPMKSVNDLVDRTLTLTQPMSNSGYKAPLVILMNDFGLHVERDFLIRNSFSHDASIAGIADGTYEAAAVASDMITRAIARGAIAEKQFRVIYTSERFPTAGLGYVYNLKPELATKIREAFFSFKWASTGLEEEYGPAGVDRFVQVSYKDDWALIRRIDDARGFKHSIK